MTDTQARAILRDMEKPEPKRGSRLLADPRLNKGTAFTLEERKRLKLTGLLPPSVETIAQQRERILDHLSFKATDLERYIYLSGLLDRNETLFYDVVMSDPVRFVPILYAPTVGEACLNFGHLFRRARGMYISLHDQGNIREVLQNWPGPEVRFICVSTGGRILGLGDLGANGMGIPIGKLQVYTICAAIPPQGLLPVLLDCGTNNETLLADPLYLGLKQHRPDDAQLDAFVEEFISAVEALWPRCCVHFEDWRGTDAMRYLAKYRDRICCYNDDIQGTSAVALAGLSTAVAILGQRLSDQRILFVGAGSAALGIAETFVKTMQLEGRTAQEAYQRVALFDINGLLTRERQNLLPLQQPFAQDLPACTNLLDAIATLKPTVLVGASTVGGTFNQQVIESMARLNLRPIIFALSNPTEHAECTAEEAYTWSHGQALYAAGVQFPSVSIQGKMLHPGQANNFYIFPAVSLAVFATGAKRITDEMFIVAAQATAAQVTQQERAEGRLFPPQERILATEIRTAEKVVKLIFERGLAQVPEPSDIAAWLDGLLYRPVYKAL